MEIGGVQEYPCTCHKNGTCWIVRHPDLQPPISYPTRIGAMRALNKLRRAATAALRARREAGLFEVPDPGSCSWYEPV